MSFIDEEMLSIDDLRSETITALECRHKLKAGELNYSYGADFSAGWYLSRNDEIKVGLAYKGAICAISSVGYNGWAHGLFELDEEELEGLRACSKDWELEVHEIWLSRLEQAQKAVSDAILNGQDRDLVTLAKEILRSRF
jgi:hypothetical protein